MGSRLADALGRIPFLDLIEIVHTKISPNAFITLVGVLLVSCWVDNIISLAPSAYKVVATLETIEEFLNAHWRLQLKAASTCYLSAHPDDSIDKTKNCIGEYI